MEIEVILKLERKSRKKIPLKNAKKDLCGQKGGNRGEKLERENEILSEVCMAV